MAGTVLFVTLVSTIQRIKLSCSPYTFTPIHARTFTHDDNTYTVLASSVTEEAISIPITTIDIQSVISTATVTVTTDIKDGTGNHQQGSAKFAPVSSGIFGTNARIFYRSHTNCQKQFLDYDARSSMVVTSNLFFGSQVMYHVNKNNQTLSFVKEVFMFSDVRQWCHEAAFYPYLTGNVIVGSTTRYHKRKTLMIRFYDFAEDRILAQYDMATSPVTRGFMTKGIRFMDQQNFLATISSSVVDDHVEECSQARSYKRKNVMLGGRVVHFRMKFNMEEIVAHHDHTKATSQDFEILNYMDFPFSSLDGVAYDNGLAIVADQANDVVIAIEVDPSGKLPFRLIANMDGFMMPHGVTLSKDLMAVTCYGDNSFIILKRSAVYNN